MIAPLYQPLLRIPLEMKSRFVKNVGWNKLDLYVLHVFIFHFDAIHLHKVKALNIKHAQNKKYHVKWLTNIGLLKLSYGNTHK